MPMPTPTTPPTPADSARELEGLLASLHAAHEDLLATALEHRAALSRADVKAMQLCAARHADIASRIAELETLRRRLIIALAPQGSPTTSITSIAQALPEPFRARILAAAAALRELLLRVQREVRTVREATHALAQHMDGLMQQVARVLSHAGTYSARGRIDAGAAVASGLDLTT
jgi:hypothetical protein